MSKIKYNLFFITATIMAAFLFVDNRVFAEEYISSVSLNENQQNITINPNNGEKVSISINTNRLVKFNTIAICLDSDSLCSRTSEGTVKYFTQTTLSNNVKKDWDGKNSSGSIVNNGEYKIKITMKDEAGVESIEFSPFNIIINSTSIIIDDPVDDDNSTTTVATSTTSTSTATTTVVTQTKIRYVYVSTHSSSEDLSDYISGNSFEISAGRDRISYVGVPVIFNAKHNKKDKRVDFTWSFGDGTSGVGQEIEHIYQNPGDYIVILNSKNGENDAVSRANIKVLEPKLSILKNKDGLEITNNGDYEINIGDWKINNINGDVMIPKDTIVGSKSKIIIPYSVFSVLNSIDNNLFLKNQSNEIFALDNGGYVEQLSVNNEEGVVVQNDSLEKILGMKVEDAENIVYTYRSNMEIDRKIKESKTTGMNNIVIEDNIDNLASVNEILISTTTEGVLKKIIYSPVRGVKNIIGRFYDL
jgi:hypothetical protein